MNNNHKAIILNCPEHIKPFRNNKETISIDEGIVETIKHLWKNDIITLNCCQGISSYLDGRPTIIISEGYKKTDIDRIKKIIADVDDRNVAILQWNLIEV